MVLEIDHRRLDIRALKVCEIFLCGQLRKKFLAPVRNVHIHKIAAEAGLVPTLFHKESSLSCFNKRGLASSFSFYHTLPLKASKNE
jgi:hypothetical protein